MRIARESLISCLDPGEKYIGDGGYYDGEQWSDTPTGLHEFSDRQKSVVRARHETINRRFKQWGILKEVYRHPLETHGAVFRAVANITQLMIREGEPLFDVEYNSNEH